MNSAPSARAPFSPARTIVFGGLAVGTVDICWAFLMAALDGKGPISVLQSVAGGIFGASTYDRGMTSALVGMVSHYFIATCWATAYYLVSRRVPALVRQPFLFGPLYGAFVYLVMYQFVIPMSAWHGSGLHPIAHTANFLKGLFIHLFGVGLLAALVARRGSVIQPE